MTTVSGAARADMRALQAQVMLEAPQPSQGHLHLHALGHDILPGTRENRWKPPPEIVHKGDDVALGDLGLVHEVRLPRLLAPPFF